MLNERPTPETDEFNCKWDSYSRPFEAIDLARKLERERDEYIDALMKIEKIFVDGENTHDDWFKMGSIAREYFKI